MAGATFHRRAAAATSCCLARAAAAQVGPYWLRIELEPPVSWLKISSGRASARVTVTWSRSRSMYSAIIIAIAVVMPWPTSVRIAAKDAVPSGLTITVIRPEVGSAARFCASPRSKISSGSGSVGIEASAACGSASPEANCTPTASVGAASR